MDKEKLLLEARFREIGFYGSFDFSPYDKTSSQSLIAVAKR